MKINKIILKNYRQFRDVTLNFNQTSTNSLHVIIAVMGTGKTNLLNAVNWCFYNEEPYLSLASQQLPLLNLNALKETDDGKDVNVKVEIWVESNSHKMVFAREAIYSCSKNKPTHQGTTFNIKTDDEEGNTKIITDKEAISHVERMVPQNIREFFFFDGERLDKYFREATGPKIQNAIFKISHIDILETVGRNLQSVIYDLRKEAGKQFPEIEKKTIELEQKEKILQTLESQIENCKAEIQTAKECLEKLNNELRGIPDIEQLQKEIESQKDKKASWNQLYFEKIMEKKNLIFEYGKILMLQSAIIYSIRIISEKRLKKEIPPTIDKELLKNILENKQCICGNNILPESSEMKNIEQLLNGIELSSEISKQLLLMENPLRLFQKEIDNFKQNLESISKEIKEFQSL